MLEHAVHTPPAGGTGLVAILPAYNEAERVAGVIGPVRASGLADEIIVVDNASRDATGRVAREAGARVVEMPMPGKGHAMAAGVASTDARKLLFLDADLIGLTPRHVEQLAAPVLAGEAEMTRGLMGRGEAMTNIARRIAPVLTGQRAMDRAVFEHLLVPDVGNWGVEQALNGAAKLHGHQVLDVRLDDLTHVIKRDKYASPIAGELARWKMFGQAGSAGIRFSVRHRLPTSAYENAVDAARQVLVAAAKARV